MKENSLLFEMYTATKHTRTQLGDTVGTYRFSDNSGPLKVLVLDEEIPYPPNSGKRIRTWNLLRRLAKRHSVSLLCYGHAGDVAIEAVRKTGIRLHLVEPKVHRTGWGFYLQLFLNLFSTLPFSVTKHYSSHFSQQFRTLLAQESWDLVHCEWTPYARFVSEGCPVPVFVSSHNIESQIWARRKQNVQSAIAKLFFWTQELKMRRFELRALQRASGVTAVTSADVDTMRHWGIKRAALIPNGVDLNAFALTSEAAEETEILFLASLDWHPNIDALQYFTREILPSLLARRPQIRLRIVGRKPAESLKKQFAGTPGVDFTGEVENVVPYLARAAVFVVPLRIGGGSRIKILEALAAGKAVVSTSIGAEGLDLIPGKHLFIADSPSEFARRVDELLASKELRRRVGEQGRAFVHDRYGWDGIAAQLEKVWLETVVKQPTAAPSAPICSTPQEVHATP